MNNILKRKLINVLKAEGEYILKSEEDVKIKAKKMDDVLNMTKLLQNYEEFEPSIQKMLNNKAKKDKWKER